MGIACTNILDRSAASLGLLHGVKSQFETSLGVKGGGILLAIPFLDDNGAFDDIEKYFDQPKAYYSLIHIFLFLHFMSLSRIKNPEQLYLTSPGELGKCLGLDRGPECKTIRRKVSALANSPMQYEWANSKTEKWLNDDSFSGIILVDGHVKTYTGSQTNLPKRYKTGRRLCLSGMMDYWVNDDIGNPLFVITTVLTSGMTKIIRDEIVSNILKNLKNCPSDEELANDPDLHKFILIYDRESYGFPLMLEMRVKSIACQTYNKYPKEDWQKSEFSEQEVRLVHGNIEVMEIAEKVYSVDVKAEKGKTSPLKVREVRCLMPNGHQTSIISTDYKSTIDRIASNMFARWCQENYLKYMSEHFALDSLTDYGLQDIVGTSIFVSSAYKKAESMVKSLANKVGSLQKKLGKLIGNDEAPTEKAKKEGEIKAEKEAIKAEIETKKNELNEAKKTRKATAKHIKMEDMPEDEKFKQLSLPGKHFVNIIKMTSYRAETAMSILIAKWQTETKTNSRSIARGLYASDADIVPDHPNKILNIKIHTQSTPNLNKITKQLCDYLNEENVFYPRTEYKMKYHLLGDCPKN